MGSLAMIEGNRMKSILLILFSISLAVGGQYLLKVGMNQVGRIGGGNFIYYKDMMFKTFLHPYVLIGLALYVISSIAWLVVLSRVNLSFAYPFASLGYIAVLLISWQFLDEPVNTLRIIGAMLIGIGIIFISRS
ncbi:MAG TPA: EamA family transporter [Candidatus Aquicultor sp.]|jgi:multidrug transporter EmrE-like cation transporter